MAVRYMYALALKVFVDVKQLYFWHSEDCYLRDVSTVLHIVNYTLTVTIKQ